MKVILISDTHGLHRKLKLPDADMIIHCGDFSSRGRPLEVFDFLDWYAKLPYKNKILVFGNHELGLEHDSYLCQAFMSEAELRNVIVLNHEHRIIAGYNFFGSPFTPEFCGWAFMYPRNDGLEMWKKVKLDTEILVTHGPPHFVMDKGLNGLSAGCVPLFNKTRELPNLKLHCFGHFHGCFGKEGIFVNASSCTEEYKLRKVPYHVIELEDKNV